MTLVILPSAIRDLEDGFAFYEDQESGAGTYFYDCLFGEIDGLHKTAGIHAKRFGHHRMLANRHPYAIYYTIEDGTVFVRRVLDCRRDPTWIRRQFK
ncbi:hypothetical protein AYO49_03755 [Verrucomicrobiaceae bacterium SCGC AG-212-N21]|nr:hypothetical protein AYO49_03755 [Verrucomicrobiaceae bacterium SCGC AG-212-N21]